MSGQTESTQLLLLQKLRGPRDKTKKLSKKLEEDKNAEIERLEKHYNDQNKQNQRLIEKQNKKINDMIAANEASRQENSDLQAKYNEEYLKNKRLEITILKIYIKIFTIDS